MSSAGSFSRTEPGFYLLIIFYFMNDSISCRNMSARIIFFFSCGTALSAFALIAAAATCALAGGTTPLSARFLSIARAPPSSSSLPIAQNQCIRYWSFGICFLTIRM